MGDLDLDLDLDLRGVGAILGILLPNQLTVRLVELETETNQE